MRNEEKKGKCEHQGSGTLEFVETQRTEPLLASPGWDQRVTGHTALPLKPSLSLSRLSPDIYWRTCYSQVGAKEPQLQVQPTHLATITHILGRWSFLLWLPGGGMGCSGFAWWAALCRAGSSESEAIHWGRLFRSLLSAHP